MLRLFGPQCPSASVDPASLPPEACQAVWIDLLDPTKEEEAWAEKLVGKNIPSRDEMLEIEPSSRLYETDDALVMTMSVLHGVDEGLPASDPISFVLTDRHLVSIRYVAPKPMFAVIDQASANPDRAGTPLKALILVVDAFLDRLADEIEAAGRELSDISLQTFDRDGRTRRRNPERRYEALMLRIGATQRLLAKVRETSVSAGRLLGFLAASDPVQADAKIGRQIKSLSNDAHAIDDHSSFLNENLTFLLDASLGMISLEQNFVMKIFSVVAVVLMPPTLIAGIYGMNFKYMPELDSPYGYWGAIVAMLLSATVPYLWARRKGWL